MFDCSRPDLMASGFKPSGPNFSLIFAFIFSTSRFFLLSSDPKFTPSIRLISLLYSYADHFSSSVNGIVLAASENSGIGPKKSNPYFGGGRFGIVVEPVSESVFALGLKYSSGMSVGSINSGGVAPSIVAPIIKSLL